MSAIFLRGNDLQNGRDNFNVLREGSNWFHVSAAGCGKRPWPKGSKDAYVFFLQQCNAPNKRL